jgi:hypothetical protein
MTLDPRPRSTIPQRKLVVIGLTLPVAITAVTVAGRRRGTPDAPQPTSRAGLASLSPSPALRSTIVPNTRSKIMFRFISWLAIGIAAAFLAAASPSVPS